MKKNSFKLMSLLALCSISFIGKGQSISENTQLKMFAHGGYTLKNDKPSTGSDKLTHAFNTGGFNFYLTSQLSEKITYVGELFLGFKGDGATFVDFNLERSYMKYLVNDYFQLRAGRMYVPLGYWNDKYNQGMIFQPTINRPYITRNQNDKGIISSTGNGLLLAGENIGKFKFSYYGFIGNTMGAPSLNTDNSKSKAITAKIKIEPIDGFQIFTSFNEDIVEAGGLSIAGKKMTNKVNQSIINGGISYFNSDKKLEFVAEYFSINNRVDDANKTNTTNTGAYAYLGYKLNKITPYVQYDLIEYDKKDIYFDGNNLRGIVAGFRFAPSNNSILKAEYKYRGTTKLQNQDVFSIQYALTF